MALVPWRGITQKLVWSSFINVPQPGNIHVREYDRGIHYFSNQANEIRVAGRKTTRFSLFGDFRLFLRLPSRCFLVRRCLACTPSPRTRREKERGTKSAPPLFVFSRQKSARLAMSIDLSFQLRQSPCRHCILGHQSKQDDRPFSFRSTHVTELWRPTDLVMVMVNPLWLNTQA